MIKLFRGEKRYDAKKIFKEFSHKRYGSLELVNSVERWNKKKDRSDAPSRSTSSSAIAERPRDARVTSIRKIAKWNFWATLLGGLAETYRCFMCTSLEEAWSTSYRW